MAVREHGPTRRKTGFQQTRFLSPYFTWNGLFLLGVVAVLYFWVTLRLKGAIESEYKQKQQELERQNAEKLEAYRNSLNHRSEIALAKLTADLELKASERNIKLKSIFVKQADTVVTFYQRLVCLYERIHTLIWLEIQRSSNFKCRYRLDI